MFPNFETIIWIPLAIFFVWLIVLSIFFYRLFAHYRRLTEGISKKDLQSVLEKLLKDQEEQKKLIDEGIKQLRVVQEAGLSHLQKVGLLRFNPFAETGGDQSFCLALLDDLDNGLVISSLHSRETTRIYSKPVKNGKEAGYVFSEEEKKAIVKAQKIK